jgi:hypothetical protein
MRKLTAMVSLGSSSYDSPSYCEPTHLAWESISGWRLACHSVDTHLFKQVLKPGGIAELEPLFVPGGGSR